MHVCKMRDPPYSMQCVLECQPSMTLTNARKLTAGCYSWRR